ncbi:hypothetical protein JG687_00000513 [Phytophthora cactorum]|uniref:Uncharacterized protein n=1 Tax=Phytophthora cactorum TaxID=29920 RepID=A0A8T1V2J7_9STRA|nr:hypothetical protein JG687_00000513 [Phytophthora cactorum]
MADNILTATHPPAAFTPRQIAEFYFKRCLDDEGELPAKRRARSAESAASTQTGQGTPTWWPTCDLPIPTLRWT